MQCTCTCSIFAVLLTCTCNVLHVNHVTLQLLQVLSSHSTCLMLGRGLPQLRSKNGMMWYSLSSLMCHLYFFLMYSTGRRTSACETTHCVYTCITLNVHVCFPTCTVHPISGIMYVHRRKRGESKVHTYFCTTCLHVHVHVCVATFTQKIFNSPTQFSRLGIQVSLAICLFVWVMVGWVTFLFFLFSCASLL